MDKGTVNGTTSLLSKEVIIEGEIQGSENLQVEGKFKGTIKIAGDIYVGSTGVIEAEIEAEERVLKAHGLNPDDFLTKGDKE